MIKVLQGYMDVLEQKKTKKNQAEVIVTIIKGVLRG